MNKKSLFAVFLAVFCAVSAMAQTIELSIRFYDKKVYHVTGNGGEPIYVQVTLTNRTPNPFRFKLADERIFSIDFDVRNLANQSLEPADYLLRKRGESRNVFFREVAIEPGESFSFVEDIRHYATLKDAGSFVVQAKIFPELFRASAATSPQGVPLSSNLLNLNLRPPALLDPDGVPVQLDEETGAKLNLKNIPPDQVVSYVLDARIKGQWEKFFLYLDIESMITNDPVRRSSWLNEGEEGHLRMIAKYKADLKSEMVDTDIAMIPSDYRIENTSYSGDTGTVVVTQWFKIGRITERRRYTYILRKQDDIWKIHDYTVTRLGTE